MSVRATTCGRPRGSTRCPRALRGAARILPKVNGLLPRQKPPFWRLPAALLDWQFAPAWPRVAALAGCALIGFSIGIAGVDRSLAPPDTQIASHEIGTMVFGPELFR